MVPPIRATGAASLAAASLLAVLSIHPAGAQEATTRASDPTVFHRSETTAWRWHLQAGINAVAEQNLFWNLAAITQAGSDYDPDKAWLEMYVKPGLSFERTVASGATFYGKLSAVASATRGTDAFDDTNSSATTLEEANVGLRGETDGRLSYDVSLGRSELRLGTGMLISNGGSSGFERGALKFGPRKAWDRAAIARVRSGSIAGTAFYLSPNELPSSESGNELAGLDVRYDDPRGGYLGATALSVLNSESSYPQAAPGGIGAPIVIPGARDGTRTLNLYAKTNPLPALPNWTFAADVAIQRNDRIDLEAWAGRVQAAYVFQNRPWSPTLTYSFQTFSGDDPVTSKLERFDPLYYEGNPNAWSTGSKSSMTFINSNLLAHAIALRVQPTQRDTLTLRYSHIRANELGSPIQFGQATREIDTGNGAIVVAGVTDAHLADDLFLEYNRVLSSRLFLTAGVAISAPGRGIRVVTTGDDPTWTGGFVNVVVNY